MDDEDRESLAALLGTVVQWQLPGIGWDRVDQALATLDEALGGQPDAVHRAAAALMLAGPHRAGRGLADVLDQPRPKPVPERTRDLVNRLLRRLGPPPCQADADSDTGADDAA